MPPPQLLGAQALPVIVLEAEDDASAEFDLVRKFRIADNVTIERSAPEAIWV